jgi:hypothetical protein
MADEETSTEAVVAAVQPETTATGERPIEHATRITDPDQAHAEALAERALRPSQRAPSEYRDGPRPEDAPSAEDVAAAFGGTLVASRSGTGPGFEVTEYVIAPNQPAVDAQIAECERVEAAILSGELPSEHADEAIAKIQAEAHTLYTISEPLPPMPESAYAPGSVPLQSAAPAQAACGLEGHAEITVSGPPQPEEWTEYETLDGTTKVLAIEIDDVDCETLFPADGSIGAFEMPAAWIEYHEIEHEHGYIVLAANGEMTWAPTRHFAPVFFKTVKAEPTPEAAVVTAPSEETKALQRAGYAVADNAELTGGEYAAAKAQLAKEAEVAVLEDTRHVPVSGVVDHLAAALELIARAQDADYSSLLVAAGKDIESARGWVVKHLAAGKAVGT